MSDLPLWQLAIIPLFIYVFIYICFVYFNEFTFLFELPYPPQTITDKKKTLNQQAW